MGNSDTAPPGWIRTYAVDCRPNDLLRVAGEHYRVEDRTYPGLTEAQFAIILPDGSQITLGKLTNVEIFDPDGSVGERVRKISRGQW